MKYAIIGNSYAAVGAVEGIRSVDRWGEIQIFSDEPYKAYARPLISYFIQDRVVPEKMYYRTNEFYEKYKPNLVLGNRVEKVDVEKRSILLDDGTVSQYDKLLVCSGSKPYIPPIKGIKAKNVMGFKKWDDAKKLKELAATYKNVVALGGGLIGLKAAEGLRNIGLNVSIVSKGPRAMHLILDKAAGELVNKHIRDNGIDLVTGHDVVEVLSNDSGDVSGVKLENGDILPCEILIVGKGVRPNIEFLDGSSIEVNYGIAVDRNMKTSVDNVYAAGDVAEAWDLLNCDNKVIAIAPLSFEQGRVAGNNMAGRSQVYAGGISMNSIEVFGLSVMSIGMAARAMEGSENKVFHDSSIYRKLVFHDEKLIGAILVGSVDHAGVLTALIRSQTNITDIKEQLCSETLETGDFISIMPKVGGEAKAQAFM